MGGYMNLSAFIGISDYADAKKHHCGGNSVTLGAHTAGMPTADANGNYRINNDALLMSGDICQHAVPAQPVCKSKQTGLPLKADIDGDAKVDIEDLLKLLAHFGMSC